MTCARRFQVSPANPKWGVSFCVLVKGHPGPCMIASRKWGDLIPAPAEFEVVVDNAALIASAAKQDRAAGRPEEPLP
jgi:hypothetical protein